jgi:ribosomal 50S subunit-recycling heat shock protein
MQKILLASVLSILSCNISAQSATNSDNESGTEATYKVSKAKKRYKFFSDEAPVTMADGTVKAIADVKVGEHVRTCMGGKSVSTQVRQIDVYDKPSSKLTAVYLRPAVEKPGTDHTMVPALLLEATPDHKVQTNRGKKRLKKLSKKDILYHYDPSTGIVSNWKVGAIHNNAREVSKAYNLETEYGTYLVDNVVVANN